MNDDNNMTPEEPKCWIESTNDSALQRTQDEFTREYGAELADNCNHLIIEVASRYLQIKDGKPPYAFGGFDRDEIARTLAAETTIRYNGYVRDTANGGDIVETVWETDAIESWDRRKFIEAFDRYLAEMMTFAKARGAGGALRDCREARQIINAASSSILGFAPLAPDDALRVVELEKAASEALSAERGAAK